MGCDASKATTITEHERKGEGETFTENQIDTIRSTWPLLSKDISTYGTRVFLMIFLVEPRIKATFKMFSKMNDEELTKNSTFVDHVTKFMQTVGVVVDNLESERNEVEKMLLMLGAKHATFDGFREDYFRIYTKSMLEVWESVIGEEFISEVRDSWKVVFSYITRFMSEGYQLYLQEQVTNGECEHEQLNPTTSREISLQA